MSYPKPKIANSEIDLKLGIKSSLPNATQAIVLSYLIWKCGDKKSQITYSKQNGDGLFLRDELFAKISDLLQKNVEKFDKTVFDTNILTNPLLKAQIEALIVGFELVWKLARFQFVDGSSFSAERTGGKRFEKIISYTSNIDILDLLVQSNEKAFLQFFYEVLTQAKISSTVIFDSFRKLLTVFSETAIYKIEHGGNDLIFDNLGIYKSILEDNNVILSDDKENKGASRILKSAATEGLNYYLSGSSGVFGKNQNLTDSELKDYAKRVENFLELTNIKIHETDNQLAKNETSAITIPSSRNRIIFGAPGTGKSHKLKEDSEQFENQEPIESDEKDIIKQEIIEANELNDKLNRYIAIGFSHSEFLKDYTTKQIRETFEIENCEDNIYVGAKAKFYYDKYIEDNDDDETITKRINEAKAIKGDGMLQVLAGIGFRFSETLMDYTKEELKKEYPLDSRPQIYWVYRAVHGAKYIKTKKQEKIKYLERVTFHPNYSYAQFVGTYKPVQDSADENQIKYEYIPGPFMRIYVAAKQNPSQNFLLLIEEINRANVAAVFGDVFQLLDRDENGNSEYPVAASEDIKKYLAKNGIHEDELKIPSNMYIWATMNSADQGVFPMDTAFKRRWEFEYIDINKNADKLVDEDNKPILIPIPSKEGKIAYKEIKYDLYKWNDVREKINEKLSEISSVSEDKLLGSFFINLEKLRSAKDEPQEFIDLFKSKVLMYLFEDVVKISPTKLFEKCGDHPRYSTICSKFDEIGCGIFGIELEKQNPSETEPSETPNE